jgi:hypothetical protein
MVVVIIILQWMFLGSTVFVRTRSSKTHEFCFYGSIHVIGYEPFSSYVTFIRECSAMATAICSTRLATGTSQHIVVQLSRFT